MSPPPLGCLARDLPADSAKSFADSPLQLGQLGAELQEGTVVAQGLLDQEVSSSSDPTPNSIGGQKGLKEPFFGRRIGPNLLPSHREPVAMPGQQPDLNLLLGRAAQESYPTVAGLRFQGLELATSVLAVRVREKKDEVFVAIVVK